MCDRDDWESRRNEDIPPEKELYRLGGRNYFWDTTAMESTWMGGDYGNQVASFAEYNRIVNNVTIAWPHPGLMSAAKDPINNIPQPDADAGTGQYRLRASVVSPALNVMCVNMNPEELAPLIYGTFPVNMPSRCFASLPIPSTYLSTCAFLFTGV